MPSVCCRTSGNDVNRTLIPGRLSRAMHAKATPLGVPDGNRTRVINSSIRFGCSKASMADIEFLERNDIVSCCPQRSQGWVCKTWIIMDEDNTGRHRGAPPSFMPMGKEINRCRSDNSQSRERTLAQRDAPAVGRGDRLVPLPTSEELEAMPDSGCRNQRRRIAGHARSGRHMAGCIIAVRRRMRPVSPSPASAR